MEERKRDSETMLRKVMRDIATGQNMAEWGRNSAKREAKDLSILQFFPAAKMICIIKPHFLNPFIMNCLSAIMFWKLQTNRTSLTKTSKYEKFLQLDS